MLNMVSILFYSIDKYSDSDDSSDINISGDSVDYHQYNIFLLLAVILSVILCFLYIKRFRLIFITITSINDITIAKTEK